ncbi:hypothetical protein ACFVYC_01975 [Pseudarthrobacter sp. NPDC058329]
MALSPELQTTLDQIKEVQAARPGLSLLESVEIVKASALIKQATSTTA